jgi:ABC-type branched-subunit amino acid transport system substrate-binding protein
MTVGMRIRMWAKRAPRAQVVVTTVVALTLFAALAAISVPTRPSSASGLLAMPAARGSGSGSGAGGDTATGAPGAPDASADSAAGGVPVSGSGATAAAKAVGTATSSPAASVKQALRASDVGVTESTIKLGFLNVQVGGFDATGFALGWRNDLDQIEKALVDSANAGGGVNGRKLTYVTGKADPLSQTSMRAACIKMADDDKVFAVFDQTALSGPALGCYPEKKMPAFTTNAGTVDTPFWNNAGGYLVSGGATFDRQALNWATFNLESGFLGPGKGKLGILSQDCPPDPAVIDNVLKPFLQKHGVAFAEQRLSCDAGTAQQQVGSAALELRRAGVDRVVLLALFTASQSFVQAAEGQGWTPKYSVMDHAGLTLDVTTQGFSPTAFDGATGYTYGRSGEERANVPMSAGPKHCSDIIVHAGLPPITDQMGKDGLAIAACDHFFTWLEAMRHTPVNPTRRDLISGVTAIGDFPLATFSLRSVFSPQKFQGGDAFSMIRWSGSCSCFTQVHRPVPARY